MDLLNKLTIKNLKLNKKRTTVTIIGIMLSVALITAVATMYSSAIKSLINYETYHKGNFHIAFYDVPTNEIYKIENNRGIEELYLTSNIGYADLEKSKNENKPYAFIKAFTKSSLDNLSVKLIEGRLPENENEIVIPSHLKTNGRVVLNVGDNITLNVGKRITLDGKELKQENPFQKENEEIVNTTTKTYKIVGKIERPATNIEVYEAPGYTFITYMNDNATSNNYDVYARFNKSGSKNYISVFSNVVGIDENIVKNGLNHNFSESEPEEYDRFMEEMAKAKYKFDINSYLITLENDPLGDDTMAGLGIVVGIVCFIIVLSSVFCIKNSFDISITEKIRQYGMLRSVGATKKQIKHNVFYEGTILGLIGIPLGLLLGLFASWILVIISNLFLKDVFSAGLKLVLAFSWMAMIIAVILGIVTIYLSALRSANKAAKVSPIESIRNSAEIKINAKKVKSSKIIKGIFGVGGDIAYKNMKRNKKKYRTTIISIVISVAVFIGLSYFVNGAFNSVKQEIKTIPFDLSLSISDGRANDTRSNKALETIKLDNIENYSIQKKCAVGIKNPKYNKEFIKAGSYGEDFLNSDGHITIYTIGDYQFKKYLTELNLNYNEYKDKGILYQVPFEYGRVDSNGNEIKTNVVEFDFNKGDVVSIVNRENERTANITIGTITDKEAYGEFAGDSYIVVSDSIYNNIYPEDSRLAIYYSSSNPDKLQDEIDEVMKGEEYYLQNVSESAKMMNNLFTLVAIFLYGFIIVISLIGITNIFNTITTNMNLRKREFATLKSVGMTSKEFKKMIRLESVFIGAKSLFFGIPIGLGISYLIYNFMEKESGFVFKFPIVAIIISIVVVYLLITILMRYAMNKINKENTIETIRNENI